jgi:hypothetical protein
MNASQKGSQKGFGTRQAILLVALAALAAFYFTQKYGNVVGQTRVSEAFHLAAESKLRVAEFYTLSARFPENPAEKAAVTTNILTPPDFVSEITIEEEGGEHDVVIRIYFKDGVLKNTGSDRQFVYLAGDLADNFSRSLRWNCGASGVDDSLLPGDCRG